MHSKDRPALVLLTVEEAAKALSLSRSTVYELLRQRDIASVTLGRSRRVAVVDIEKYVQELRNAA